MHAGIKLAESGYNLTSMIVQTECLKIAGGMVLAQQVIIPQAYGPVQVLLLACHPVQPGQDLQLFPVDLHIQGGEGSEFCLYGGICPYIVRNGNHSIGPGRGPQEFG